MTIGRLRAQSTKAHADLVQLQYLQARERGLDAVEYSIIRW